MGAFIPVNVDGLPKIPDYAFELELLTRELEKNSTLQLSQFCSSRSISYQGFKSYLDKNGVNLRQLRMGSVRKTEESSVLEFPTEALAGVTIKLPNNVEISIPSVLPLQLSNLLKLL